MRYLLYFIAIAFFCYLLTGVKQIQPGERAVVRRFGQVVDKPGPGLRIGWPYPIEKVDRVAVDLVQRVSIGFRPDVDEDDLNTPDGQLLTGDHNLVNVQILLDYSVRNDELEDYVIHRERADSLISRAAEAILAEWVAGRKVDDVLLRGKMELPEVLVRQTQARIDPYRLGVVIQGASIAHLYPPTEVKQAFDEVTRAQTAIRTREYEARQEAARKQRESESEKNRLLTLAASYAGEQKVLARAEAEKFTRRLKQYEVLRKDNPHFLAGIWWDEMGKLFAKLKESGKIDLLDNHLGADGLDITITPLAPRKR